MEAIEYLEDERKKLWAEIEDIKKVKLPNIQEEIQAISEITPLDIKESQELIKSIKKLQTQYRTYNQQITNISQRISNFEVAYKKIKEQEETLLDINTKANDSLEQIKANETEIITKSENIINEIEKTKTFLEEHTGLKTDIEEAEETILKAKDVYEKISNFHTNAAEKRQDIETLYDEIMGYTTEDGEDVTGIKDELEVAYNDIQKKVSDYSEDIKKFKGEKKAELEAQINQGTKDFLALKNKIEDLLGGALVAGLSSAYIAKKNIEKKSVRWATFFFMLILGVIIAITTIVFYKYVELARVEKKSLEDIIKNLPILTISLSPIYAPLLWLGIHFNKKINLAKKLMEEYTHKEVVSTTYYGLIGELEANKDDENYAKLKIKLLEQTVAVNADNPGKYVNQHNKSDNPIFELLHATKKISKEMEGNTILSKGMEVVCSCFTNAQRNNNSNDKKTEED